jgi:hypothetical protein
LLLLLSSSFLLLLLLLLFFLVLWRLLRAHLHSGIRCSCASAGRFEGNGWWPRFVWVEEEYDDDDDDDERDKVEEKVLGDSR